MERQHSTPDSNDARAWQLTAGEVQLYRAADLLSGAAILFLVLFAPWAFGSTEAWSIRVVNGAGIALLLLSAAKWFIRRARRYQPPRWDRLTDDRESRPAKIVNVALGTTAAIILLYCLVSALNARAVFRPEQASFEYFEAIPWLPASLDASRTWATLLTGLGLAGLFWGTRDWLAGLAGGELARNSAFAGRESPPFPARLRRLLWVLAINSGLLAIEGIAQRIEGSGRLLFLIRPAVNPEAVTQFGPWAYRANAAQYFNLLWPLVLGFWWTLQRSSASLQKRHHALLACAVLMAACPVISTSRGGALITLGQIVSAVVFLGGAHFLMRGGQRAGNPGTLAAIALFALTTAALAFAFGWSALAPRLAEAGEGFAAREELYAAARPMAQEYPLYGTGPGTFETVFALYRDSAETYWPAQLHNDWLEMRITFGLVGSGVLVLLLPLVLARWFCPGGIHGGRRFVVLLWISVAGLLVHARFDFPFQIHSVLTLFVVVCAVLSSISRRPG